MKHIKEVISNIKTLVMNGVISTIETVWAIGTSIAGTDVLRKWIIEKLAGSRFLSCSL